eukprot:m.53705 g.53705  ORF g.53705 m.53705 type:complete len:574 (+) comp15457_c0_seq1:312-2033(+)
MMTHATSGVSFRRWQHSVIAEIAPFVTLQKRHLRQRFSVENKKRYQKWQQDSVLCPSHARTVMVPRSLAQASNHVIKNCGLRRRTLRKDTQKLHDFLFGRRVVSSVPVEQGIESDFHPTLMYGPREAVTFLAARQPLCYGATHMVLKELQLRRPDFIPTNVLDFGTGTASAIWATESVWPTAVELSANVDRTQFVQSGAAEDTLPQRSYVGVDLSLHMLEIASTLLTSAQLKSTSSDTHEARVGSGPAKSRADDHTENSCRSDIISDSEADEEYHNPEVPKNVTFRQTIPVPSADVPAYDLVTSAFSLCEIKSAKLRRSTVLELWRNTSDCLVLVESGNIQGFSLIQEARDTLIEATAASDDGEIIAPCCHMLSCPRADAMGFPPATAGRGMHLRTSAVPHGGIGEAEKKPCHFPIRAAYPQTQRFGPMETRSGIRTEKISYLVFTRKRATTDTTTRVGRIVSALQHRSGHVSMHVCTTAATLPLPATPHREDRASRRRKMGDEAGVAAVADAPAPPSMVAIKGNSCDDASVIRVVTVPRSGGKDAWRDCKARQWGDVVPLMYPKLVVAQPQG